MIPFLPVLQSPCFPVTRGSVTRVTPENGVEHCASPLRPRLRKELYGFILCWDPRFTWEAL